MNHSEPQNMRRLNTQPTTFNLISRKMTNSNLRTENHFDYVKISIASPQRIMDWTENFT